MLYDYRCTNCQQPYSIHQKISDIHQYVCPVCGHKCVREWNSAPTVKISDGFFTWQFSTHGDWVSGIPEYDKKLAKVRTLQGMDKYLGVNQAKEEHVEARHQNVQANIKRTKRELAETEEYVSELQHKGVMD